MYTDYFGLKENPFSIAPDPRYLYMSELHREALAHLLYGIASDGCFILLTGDVGTGKTTVCRCLLAQLPSNTEVALILNPRLTVIELLETICDELGVPTEKSSTSTKAYIDRLNRYLLEAHGRGKNVALLIDEAQNLSLDLLEQLRLLTNLETDQKKLLKIVLLGQSELKGILEQPNAAQINQRITSRYHLLPLDRDNSFAYIHHRLGVAGKKQKIFSKSALARIFELSKGIPRLINVLCDRSLLGAYVDEKYLINDRIVNKAAKEVLGSEIDSKAVSSWNQVSYVVLLTVLVAVAAYYYFHRESLLEEPSGTKTTSVAKPFPQNQLEQGASLSEQVEEEVEVPVEKEKTPEITVAEETEMEEKGEPKTSIRIVPLEISE